MNPALPPSAQAQAASAALYYTQLAAAGGYTAPSQVCTCGCMCVCDIFMCVGVRASRAHTWMGDINTWIHIQQTHSLAITHTFLLICKRTSACVWILVYRHFVNVVGWSVHTPAQARFLAGHAWYNSIGNSAKHSTHLHARTCSRQRPRAQVPRLLPTPLLTPLLVCCSSSSSSRQTPLVLLDLQVGAGDHQLCILTTHLAAVGSVE